MKTELPVINCLTPKCGACCMEQAYLPVSWYSFEQEALQLLPEPVKVELAALHERLMTQDLTLKELEGPCVWLNLDTMQCRHYEHRPGLCRDSDNGEEGVIPGNESCVNWREQYGIK